MAAEGIVSDATPAITAVAYVADEAVGGLLIFADFPASTFVVINTVILTDLSKQSVIFDLFLATEPFTPTADNAAFDYPDNAMANILAPINIATYTASADSSVAAETELARLVKVGLTGKLYGQLVTRGTPTYAVGAITIKLIAATLA